MYEQPQVSVAQCSLVKETQNQYWRYYLEVCEQCTLSKRHADY